MPDAQKEFVDQLPVVLAQREVPGKTNEIPMAATLLQDLPTAGHDPASMVFTRTIPGRRREHRRPTRVRNRPQDRHPAVHPDPKSGQTS